MVDAVRVTRLLRSLDEGLASLGRRQQAGTSERQEETWLLAVKYLFVTTIEACIDIAQHLCSTESLGTPRDNGDAMRKIGAAGILTPATATALVKAVGFRNVLVQEYVDVQDTIVMDRLANHADLLAFATEVGTWLTAQESPRSGLN
ncbi:MAG: type VII toxin-antitoxin system HepT family RNase toxin [Actinomycetales bacterium]